MTLVGRGSMASSSLFCGNQSCLRLPVNNSSGNRKGNSRHRRLQSISARTSYDAEKGKPSRIQSGGTCVVEIGGKTSTRVRSNVSPTILSPPMDGVESLELSKYLEEAKNFICEVPLPLGAKIERTGEEWFQCTLPRIDIFDVWLQMTAEAHGTTEWGEIVIVSDTASLIGSHHVEDLRLYERYNCRADISWRAVDQATIECEAELVVNVDIPRPFSFMPKAVLQNGGNVALGGMLSFISEEFTKSLVRDHEQWVQSPEVRARRRLNVWRDPQSLKERKAMTIDVSASTVDWGDPTDDLVDFADSDDPTVRDDSGANASVMETSTGEGDASGDMAENHLESDNVNTTNADSAVESESSAEPTEPESSTEPEDSVEEEEVDIGAERVWTNGGHSEESSISIHLDVPLEDLLIKLRNPGSITQAELMKTRRQLEELQNQLR